MFVARLYDLLVLPVGQHAIFGVSFVVMVMWYAACVLIHSVSLNSHKFISVVGHKFNSHIPI